MILFRSSIVIVSLFFSMLAASNDGHIKRIVSTHFLGDSERIVRNTGRICCAITEGSRRIGGWPTPTPLMGEFGDDGRFDL